jgi:hypothetical protein
MKSFLDLRENKINEAPEDDQPASPDEKSMAMDQAKFLQYVGKEITEYLQKNKEFPEWMQNKLSGLHEKAKDMHAVLAGDYEDGEDDDMNEAYTSFKTGEEKSAFEAGKKAFRSGKKYGDNPYTDPKQKLAWSKGHNQAKARKLGVREETVDEAMTASQHRMAMIDKIKKSGAVKSGSMSKNEEKVDEAAPKMQGDWLKKQRERDREHNAAMGRTATGRKKPVRQMTSTQRSLASLRDKK